MVGVLNVYDLYLTGFPNDSVQSEKVGNRLPCWHDSRDKKERQATSYLFDLEREGYVDGRLFQMLGRRFLRRGEGPRESSIVWEYYQRAAGLGYAPVYLDMHRYWYQGPEENLEKAMLILLEAEAKGMKDSRILEQFVLHLTVYPYYLSRRVLGSFWSLSDMALYYCGVLTGRGSPDGEHFKKQILEEWVWQPARKRLRR